MSDARRASTSVYSVIRFPFPNCSTSIWMAVRTVLLILVPNRMADDGTDDDDDDDNVCFWSSSGGGECDC